MQPLWRAVWCYLKKLNIELPYDPAVPLLGIHPEKKLIQKENPELYEYIMEHRRKQYEALKKTKPEIAEYAKKWI